MSGHEAFPIDAAQLVGMFMENVFYGIYLITFVNCIRSLVWIEGGFKPWHKLHIKMLIAAFLMLVFATLDVAVHLRHNLEVFVGAPNPEYVIAAFNHTSYWLNVLKMVSYVAQTFVGDAILLYRCWIIYNRKWLVVVVPTLLWLGCTACGIMTIYLEATFDTDGALLNANKLVPFITSMLCLTLAMNSLTTGLIVYRIWRIQRQLKRRSIYSDDSPLSRILIILIESGLMYTFSIVILFALYMAENNGQYGVSNAVVQIIGITFNLIITSVDRESGQSNNNHASSNSMSRNVLSGNRLPLHQIHVQTTTSVARYPDYSLEDEVDVEAKKSPGAASDHSSTVRTEWRQ